MNRTILFSPVGGTDPISSTNMRDGSLLHICRVYRPDRVVLYMSKEILQSHKKDNRYLYCLDQLSQKTGWKYQYEIIERPEMENVQEFDYFYQEFRGLIVELMKTMDDSDTLLLNVSSGTPAMKSGLLVLKTLGEFPCKAIQVATPEKKMNEHIHSGYDVKLLMELNEDNEEKFENRCKEVKCPTLSMIQQENNIKRLIQEYDYYAAMELAKQLPEEETKNYLELLKMASKRVLLDFTSVDQILANNNEFMLPVKDSSIKKFFEYALSLDIKLKRGEYADYIRAISPLLAGLFEKILEKQAGIALKDYCIKSKEGSWRWNDRKMSGTKVLQVLENFCGKNAFRYGDVYSSQLCVLLIELGQDINCKKTVENLRSVESKLRNLAAHQMISVTDISIRKETGFTGEQIMEMIKKAFIYAGMNIKKECWDSYDQMNEVLLSKI